ncbi:MAG TPA: GNAT family N-acetyltransferase [Methylocystis sp.]|nr:GNAT family N-acetyltransferase [Methylocystis sp.]
MFQNANRIKFNRPVDEAGRAWWIERFYGPFGLTPEGMGDLITKSAVGDKLIIYDFIDGMGHAFRLRVEGSLSGPGEVWFVERTFELSGNLFNADEMFVADKIRGAGLGRRLMGDLIEACETLQVDRIKIQARNIGRYAWLRMGFRPDMGSWIEMRKNLIDALLRFEEALGRDAAWRTAEMVAKGGPETANVVASLEEPVPSRQLLDSFMRPVQVPLGKALLLEWTGDWSGEFMLADPEMKRIATKYLREDAGD